MRPLCACPFKGRLYELWCLRSVDCGGPFFPRCSYLWRISQRHILNAFRKYVPKTTPISYQPGLFQFFFFKRSHLLSSSPSESSTFPKNLHFPYPWPPYFEYSDNFWNLNQVDFLGKNNSEASNIFSSNGPK